MRDLHARDADGGRRVARRDPEPSEQRGPRRPRWRPLSVHRLPEDRRGGRGVAGAATETAPTTRRSAGRRSAPRIARVDGVDQVTGASRFGADRAPADALHLRAIRSPHAHARFTIGDVAALYATYPGLERVLTAADVPGQNRYGIYADREGPAGLSPTATSDSAGRRWRRWSVTRGRWRAIADSELPIAWAATRADAGPGHRDRRGCPAPPRRLPGQLLTRGRVVRGDVDRALAASAAVARGRSRRATSNTPTSSPRRATRSGMATGSRWSRRPRRHTWIATSSR